LDWIAGFPGVAACAWASPIARTRGWLCNTYWNAAWGVANARHPSSPHGRASGAAGSVGGTGGGAADAAAGGVIGGLGALAEASVRAVDCRAGVGGALCAGFCEAQPMSTKHGNAPRNHAPLMLVTYTRTRKSSRPRPNNQRVAKIRTWPGLSQPSLEPQATRYRVGRRSSTYTLAPSGTATESALPRFCGKGLPVSSSKRASSATITAADEVRRKWRAPAVSPAP